MVHLHLGGWHVVFTAGSTTLFTILILHTVSMSRHTPPLALWYVLST